MQTTTSWFRHGPFLALCALFALGALTGCVGAPEGAESLNGGASVVQSSNDGLVDATVTLGAASLARGSNSFLVALEPAADASADTPILTDAIATMPAHGHSVTATGIAPDGASYRIGDLDFFMSGLWQVDLGVALGARTDHVVFDLDVP